MTEINVVNDESSHGHERFFLTALGTRFYEVSNDLNDWSCEVIDDWRQCGVCNVPGLCYSQTELCSVHTIYHAGIAQSIQLLWRTYAQYLLIFFMSLLSNEAY